MDRKRVEAVADAVSAVGYNGIVSFDRTEPEYSTIEYLYERYDSEAHVKILILLAASQDYQLNGDAQFFWRELERTAEDFENLDSVQDVRDLLGDFMKRDVNGRLNQQKRDRLIRVIEAGFDEWFISNHDSVAPLDVWERFADDLNTDKDAKTVVLAMKIYDIAHLVKHGEYMEFPRKIPIPCDLQVKRVSWSSGITESDDTDQVLDVWAEVMEETSQRLGRHISLLRIDSIVWQAGQIIGRNEPDREASQQTLTDHFEEVGVDEAGGKQLARELIIEM